MKELAHFFTLALRTGNLSNMAYSVENSNKKLIKGDRKRTATVAPILKAKSVSRSM